MSKFLLSVVMLFSGVCAAPLSAEVYIMQPQPQGLDLLWESLGRGAGGGIERAMEEQRRRWILEENRKVQQREHEMRAHMIQREKEKNAQISKDILKDYDPTKKPEFVLEILQSELPESQKAMIVDVLDKQYQSYLLEKNKG